MRHFFHPSLANTKTAAHQQECFLWPGHSTNISSCPEITARPHSLTGVKVAGEHLGASQAQSAPIREWGHSTATHNMRGPWRNVSHLHHLGEDLQQPVSRQDNYRQCTLPPAPVTLEDTQRHRLYLHQLEKESTEAPIITYLGTLLRWQRHFKRKWEILLKKWIKRQPKIGRN